MQLLFTNASEIQRTENKAVTSCFYGIKNFEIITIWDFNYVIFIP